MNYHFEIAPECYADTLLVEILGFYRPNHQLGISKVFDALGKRLKNRLAVGVIDDDKRKPRDLDKFEEVDKRDGIRRLKRGNHTVLIICPGFEAWVFKNAEAVDIKPAKYGFQNLSEFRKACKRIDVSENEKVKQFLNTLRQKKAPGFELLSQWIREGAGISATK